MPPPDARDLTTPNTRRHRIVGSRLDAAAAHHPRPGRTDTLRRLTRTEYKNAIRDLLAPDVDVDALLPADEASHGFDNVTVSGLSPTLLNRYITAAQRISRLAMGGGEKSPGGVTIRVRPDVTQEEHVAGLPLGTRGGALITHEFPRDGTYQIEVRLMRDRNEHVEGLDKLHELELILDRERVQLSLWNRPATKAAISPPTPTSRCITITAARMPSVPHFKEPSLLEN
jgi:hypothetical protein